jgi:hypothetical protein
MPVLLWVAFWSSLMGSAACFGEVPRPVPAAVPKQRDLSSRD